MKKLLCLLLCAMMLATAGNALALGYSSRTDNESTFETLEEARISGPEYLKEYVDTNFVADPCLDTYPQGTTYIYRSAGMFSPLLASMRMNTNILVYTEESFEGKDDALAYIKGLGLDQIIEEAGGSVVLVTPASPLTEGSSGLTGGFGQADQYAFFQLQSAMCNINNMAMIGASYPADNAYYGGLTFRYIIGIDGGATFINNYIASTFDYVTRIAGMLLVGGDMERIRDVASFVPVYLVNPSAMAVEKYKAANQVNACAYDGDDVSYFNQLQPLQKVVVSGAKELSAELVDKVYHDFLIKAERNAVIRSGLNNASTLYANYNFNQAPYSLDRRIALFNSRETAGLVITEHREDRFKDIAREDNGEYIDEWWEILPEEVLDGTAPEHSVPLVMLCHGNGDDPIQFADEAGWLTVAADHRVAVVSPCNQYIGTYADHSHRYAAMPAVAEYMLAQYPALDPTRVYVNGYSMGGDTTFVSLYAKPQLFAAAVPMAAMPGSIVPTQEQLAAFETLDMPTMILSSTADMAIDDDEHFIQSYIDMLNIILGYNEMEALGAPDYDAYGMLGFKADHFRQIKVNNEFKNYTWLFDNADGVPMAGVNITDFLPHGLYPEYGKVAWDFMQHYSRDPETLDVIYTPYNP